MASNTVRLLGGAAGAAALALLIVALLPRAVPPDEGMPLAAATPTPEPAPTPAVTAEAGPTVDTFLLESDGVAVVAGHAAPGQSVSILLDGVVVGQAQADAGGGFAATADIAASDQPRTLSFAVDGAAPSGERVLVRPQPQAEAEATAPMVAMAETANTAPDATAATAPDTTLAAEPVIAAQGETTVATAAETVTAQPAPTDNTMSAEASAGLTEAAGQLAGDAAAGAVAALVAAPTIILDDAGARVLPSGPQVMDRVALDAITYDDSGAVQLAGRAPGDGAVRVYVNNKPLTDGPVGPAGDWRLTLPQVDAGTYTLRIDEIAADGTVASRIETPFRRENPADVTALQQNGTGVRVATNTVQPGSTLWAIAKDNFGDGMMYVSVFEANRDQIRDPDLIYPGQVFVIPPQ